MTDKERIALLEARLDELQNSLNRLWQSKGSPSDYEQQSRYRMGDPGPRSVSSKAVDWEREFSATPETDVEDEHRQRVLEDDRKAAEAAQERLRRIEECLAFEVFKSLAMPKTRSVGALWVL